MLLPAFSLLLLLHSATARSAKTSCPVEVKECPTDVKYHKLVNATIKEVLADLNKTAEAYEFFHDYEARLHTFILDLRVALLTDQRLLERLLYLQKTHGDNFTGRPEFNKECDAYNVTRPLPEVSCPEIVTDCPSDVFVHLRVNQTIREVLQDINATTLALHEFMGDYEERMHVFIVDLRVAMLKDQRLLERLALLQKLHGSGLYWHPVFLEFCELSKIDCSNITQTSCPEGNSTTTTSTTSTTTTTTVTTTPSTTTTPVTKTTPTTPTTTTTNSTVDPSYSAETDGPKEANTTLSTQSTPTTTTITAPTTTTPYPLTDPQIEAMCINKTTKFAFGYKKPLFVIENGTRTFECQHGTSYFENQKTLFCMVDHQNNQNVSIYHANHTKYTGKLECKEYGRTPNSTIEIKRCEATCDNRATCKLYKDEEIICACQLGFADISAETKKPQGSVCKKCVKMADTDFVIVYDKSGSIKHINHIMFNAFIDDLVEFIDTEEGDNKLAVVSFARAARVVVPLTNNHSALHEFLADTKRDVDPDENDPDGLDTNTALGLYVANKEIYAKLPQKTTRRRVTIVLTDGVPSQCNQYRYVGQEGNSTGPVISEKISKTKRLDSDTCFAMEVDAVREEMTKVHKAEIFVVHVGTEDKEEKDRKVFAHVYGKQNNTLIHVDKFEDLRSQVLAKLQKKIC